MALKLVLISPSGTLVKDGKLHPPLVAELCAMISRLHNAGVRTAVWTNHRWTVNQSTPMQDYLTGKAGVPVECLGATTHGFPARRRAGSITPLLQHFGVARHEVILVGNSDVDRKAGVNNELLLVRPGPGIPRAVSTDFR